MNQAEVFQVEAFPRWCVRWQTPSMSVPVVTYFDTEEEAKAAQARLLAEQEASLLTTYQQACERLVAANTDEERAEAWDDAKTTLRLATSKDHTF